MTSAVTANLWGRWRPPISWFPGHMTKATKGVKERLKACDLVIELRDARVPFSSINTTFDVLMENKPRLLVYNKIDLADHRATQLLREQCKVSIPFS
jgi:ribosome biogenesis GTPase A